MFWLEKYGSMAPLLVALPPTPLIVSSSFPNLQAGRPTPPTPPFLLPNNPPTPLPSSDPPVPPPLRPSTLLFSPTSDCFERSSELVFWGNHV